MSAPRTLEQDRAAHAWQMVRTVKEIGGKPAGDYLSIARGGAADIQVNGLGQTLAFWRAKGRKDVAYQEMLRHLGEWVGPRVGAPGGDLLEWLVASTTGSDAYRRATWEALAYLKWVKRFAEAELEQEDRDGRKGGRDG